MDRKKETKKMRMIMVIMVLCLTWFPNWLV